MARDKRDFESCDQIFSVSEEYRGKISKVVDEIAATCKGKLGIEHIAAVSIPGKKSVIEVLNLLEDILYPGYFGEQVSMTNLEYFIGTKAHTLFERLSYQVSRALMKECASKKSTCTHCIDEGQKKAFEFLCEIPKMREILAKDVQAAFDGDPAAKSYSEIVFSYPGIKAITIYRIANSLHKKQVPLIPRIMTEYAHGITGIDIHPGADIAGHFFIDHGTGIVIGETTSIGKNVRMYQGVTLGALSFPKDEKGNIMKGKKRHPTIEDNVTIYAGATILGGKTVIGKNSVIGGNVWLTASVPPNSKVLTREPELNVVNIQNAQKKE